MFTAQALRSRSRYRLRIDRSPVVRPVLTPAATSPSTIYSRAHSTTTTPTPTPPASSSPPPPTPTHSPPPNHQPPPLHPPNLNQTLILPSGRTLGYATYGPPTGYPVFFLHGLPSCRLEGAGTEHVLDKLDVWMIAPERPGFGESTFWKGGVVDHVCDVAVLARYLGLEGGSDAQSQGTGTVAGMKGKKSRHASYGVVGGSGGGSFALACAWAADQSRVRVETGGSGSGSGSGRDINTDVPGNTNTTSLDTIASTPTYTGPPLRNLAKVGLFASAPPYVPPWPISPTPSPDGYLRPPHHSNDTTVKAYAADLETLQSGWLKRNRMLFRLIDKYPNAASWMLDRLIRMIAWSYNTPRGRRALEGYLAKALRTQAGAISGKGREGKGNMKDESHGPAITGPSTASPPSSSSSSPSPSSSPLDNESADQTSTPKPTDDTTQEDVSRLINLISETFAQKSPDGWIHQIRLLSAPWGIPLHHIQREILIWHGRKDVHAPLKGIEWLAERLVDAKLDVLEDANHFQLEVKLEEALGMIRGSCELEEEVGGRERGD